MDGGRCRGSVALRDASSSRNKLVNPAGPVSEHVEASEGETSDQTVSGAGPGSATALAVPCYHDRSCFIRSIMR